MNKLLIMPSNKKQFNFNCTGLIIGITGLSINVPYVFELTDLKDIDKEIFILLNKNMFNYDLDNLKETLLKLNNYHIKGVIFYDMSVVNLYKKLDLNYDLIWYQEHMTTNYSTVNFMVDQGIKYAYISNDITLREMKEIKQNTKSKLIINVFGYLPIFNSKRTLVNNYLKTFELKNQLLDSYLKQEGSYYPITEENETVLYSSFILNGLKEMLELDYDYFVLNSFKIEDDKFEKVIDIFNEVDYNNLSDCEDKLNRLFNNLGKGFFYEDTVYKVK